MFQSARLKLTIWYLLIIMVVSILFSVAIYKLLTMELERGFLRFSRRYVEMRQLNGDTIPMPQVLEPGYVDNAEQRIGFVLLYINVGIFGISGILGYFLAGRTLKPIKEMMDGQNRFIADASHEFRTPLTALKTSMEVYMRGKNQCPSADSLVKSNLSEVNNLWLLSDNLITLAQYGENGNGLQKETVSIKKVLDEACKKVSAFAKQKQIAVKNTQKEEYFVKGNFSSVVEIFVILLDNAIKYSPKKSSVSIVAKALDGSVCIWVTDKGIGIGDKDLAHIFERFYRADTSRTKQESYGYGLGLSIAKRLIEMHKGTISAESKVGSGSVFSVTLPTVKV